MKEFLLLLILILAITVCVLGYIVARRRSVASWPVTGNLPATVLHGRPAKHGVADACCLDVPCSQECARRQQTIHSANYAEGLRDALAYPNRVKQLIRQGRELDERPDRW
jgi:hypothetical protein